MVELRFGDFADFGLSRFAVRAEFVRHDAIDIVGQHQLPVPASDRLQLPLSEVMVEDLVRASSTGFACQQIRDVQAIDGMWGEFGANEIGDGRENVDRHGRGVLDFTRWDLPGPFGEHRNPRSTLVHGSLPFAQRPRAAGMVAVGQPWPVVAREDDQRVFFQSVVFKESENSTYNRIEFLQYISIDPAARFAAKALCCIKRHMGESVRKVQKERRVFRVLEELEGKVAVLLGQSGLIQRVDIRIDDLIAANQGELGEGSGLDHRSVRPHVVRVREP